MDDSGRDRAFLPVIPTRDEVIAGIRKHVETSESQRLAALLLLEHAHFAEATVVASARHHQIGRAILLLRTATMTDWHAHDQQHEELGENAWKRYDAWPFDWASESARLQDSRHHREMARGHLVMFQTLTSTSRGTHWHGPHDIAGEVLASEALHIGDALLAEFFRGVEHVVANEPDGRRYAIARPDHLDLVDFE